MSIKIYRILTDNFLYLNEILFLLLLVFSLKNEKRKIKKRLNNEKTEI